MRILLADDEANARYGLRVLLEQQPEYGVVGEAADAVGLLAGTEAACPDLVLLDWGLPGLAADELLGALRRVYPNLHVIVLSGRPEEHQVVLAAGADAFVSKADPPEQLLAAIQSVQEARRET